METPRAILLLLLTICSLLIIPVASEVSYDTYAELMEAMHEKSWKISNGKPNLESGNRLTAYGESLAKKSRPEKQGKRLGYYSDEKTSRPEEQGTYLEGDILFQDRPSGKRSLRNGERYRWRKGIVFYELDPAFTDLERIMIQEAMEQMARPSCIKFKVRSLTTPDYVLITRNNEGCHSAVGRRGGMQTLNLQSPGCMKLGTIQHELMHTLGFFHEHARTDRDGFVTIHFANILQGTRHNFDRMDDTNHMGIPYDYLSIMHYSRYAFAKDPNNATITINRETIVTNQHENTVMTKSDILRIKKLYPCSIFTKIWKCVGKLCGGGGG